MEGAGRLVCRPALIMLRVSSCSTAARKPGPHAAPCQFLASHGYAALMVTLRAHGDSTGEYNDIGWGARADVWAAVDFLGIAAAGLSDHHQRKFDGLRRRCFRRR